MSMPIGRKHGIGFTKPSMKFAMNVKDRIKSGKGMSRKRAKSGTSMSRRRAKSGICGRNAGKHMNASTKKFNRVHEEIMAMTKKHDRSVGALGARWGMQSDRSFRNALAGILEDNFGVKVINVNEYDEEGVVFGRSVEVESLD